ncbi:MAG TPA: hypothetical protein VG407_11740 [Caulobacteraceae bacterium]|jgi:hypothetical protein|nr:hypothetical protein [Caulobacteraceae bacterium]
MTILSRRGSLLLAGGALTTLAVAPTSVLAKPPAPPPHPDDSTAHFDSGFIRSGLPCDAWARLTMRRSGDFTFETHLHDSGADRINYTILAVLASHSGIVFTFKHSGHAGGLVGGSRNSNASATGHNPVVAREFDAILHGGTYKVRLEATDALARDMGRALTDLAKTALADPRAVVAKTMVTLVTD